MCADSVPSSIRLVDQLARLCLMPRVTWRPTYPSQRRCVHSSLESGKCTNKFFSVFSSVLYINITKSSSGKHRSGCTGWSYREGFIVRIALYDTFSRAGRPSNALRSFFSRSLLPKDQRKRTGGRKPALYIAQDHSPHCSAQKKILHWS